MQDQTNTYPLTHGHLYFDGNTFFINDDQTGFKKWASILFPVLMMLSSGIRLIMALKQNGFTPEVDTLLNTLTLLSFTVFAYFFVLKASFAKQISLHEIKSWKHKTMKFDESERINLKLINGKTRRLYMDREQHHALVDLLQRKFHAHTVSAL